MSEVDKAYSPSVEFCEAANLSPASYLAKYQQSIEDPEAFWRKEAMRLTWSKAFTKVKDVSWDLDSLSIKWFEDGALNVSVNCLDRHLPEKADKVALIWEGDEPGQQISLTYYELYERVCKFANVLKGLGVKKGDVVTLYLPMLVESVCAMLACSRIGAIHSVVFGGFSPEALAGRIDDCRSTVVITADEGLRGGKTVPLKENVDAALRLAETEVSSVLVIQNTGAGVTMQEGRDHWYHRELAKVSAHCEPEVMSAEDPLFILYTSGSTGKPKGVVHTTAGYLLWASMTHEYVFDLKEDDIFWCTADIGWITGHTYTVYGPLANGTTTLVFEGVPSYPDASRFWQVVDQHAVTVFYTAPTAIRALMREGDDYLASTSRKSLRLLGTVGEPINPEAWEWYYRKVGEERCPIVDTWWQTETGGTMMVPLPGTTLMKPGAASHPFFGVEPALLNADGKEMTRSGEGNLVIKGSWPGQMRTVYGDHKRFGETYFSTYPNYYFTGDGCRRDEDGFYWITGRVDDVINVSGHRIGTAEVESALVAHDLVAEAAVVGYPHDVKGQGIYAYVTLKAGNSPSEDLKKEVVKTVRSEIGPIATPDVIHWAEGLPKTRSGKIMRRILRKIASGELDSLGDTSTLADPTVVEDLIGNRSWKVKTAI